MRPPARLIIPLWGSVYAEKLVSMTLPALLAPGNLPSLARMFDVEVVLVTEHKLVDYIQRARSFQRLSTICEVKFASLDDLMPCEPGEYGVVLTAALFRGFVDLGAKVTETFLLFLNADFIIADGSYRRLGELMREGKRVIHAPSFRVVLEEVWPQLEARVDAESAMLAVKPREMAKLALTHKHLTVKARTVNQRLYHQWCMDQFYWYVDEETLIGYQWPIALVAIKPERAIPEPVLVWDFGYLPEAAPTLEPHANVVVAATGPRGTLVRFVETATDPDDAASAVTVACLPASGSTFALAAHRSTRSTKVTCSAHDAAGNQAAPITFTVTVLGVHAQLVALELRVSGSTRVLASAKTSLVVLLERVDRDARQGRTAVTQAQLGAFISSVARLKGLSRTTRASWEATAARLVAIVG